jgi:hypothetical protein
MWFRLYDQEAEGGGGIPPQTFKLTNEGETHEFDESAVVEAAQKGLYVLPKLQSDLDTTKAEVEELKTELETSKSFVDDFKRVMNAGGDADPEGTAGRDAMVKIGSSMGLSEEQMSGIIGNVTGEDSGLDDYLDEEDDTPQGPHRRAPKPEFRAPIKAENLDPALRQELEYLRTKRLEDLRKTMVTELDAEFDKDVTLGKIGGVSEKAGSRLRQIARETLQRRVGLEGQSYGPRLLASIVQDVRQIAEELGIQTDTMTKVDPSALGFGPAEVGDGLSELLHQEQPPERAKVTDDNYRQNLFARLVHKVKAAGGLGGGGGDFSDME